MPIAFFSAGMLNKKLRADRDRSKSLALFSSILLLLALPVTATLGSAETTIAQQSPNSAPDPNRAAAEKAFAEARQLRSQGTAESLQQALAKFQAAFQLYQNLGDRFWQGATLYNIGEVYADLGETQKALEYYDRALPLARESGDKAAQAIILNSIGFTYYNLKEPQKALEYYNQALPLSHSLGDKASEANIVTNIGAAYEELGDKEKALAYYNQGLSLAQEAGNQRLEVASLNNIATLYSALGEKQKALDYYNQTLPLLRNIGAKGWEASILVNIGSVYSDIGDKQKALEYYNQALPIVRELGDKAGEGLILNNIGTTYSELGDPQKALEYLEQSLPLRRATGNKAGEVSTLSNIGKVYDDIGEKQKAIEYYDQALSMVRELNDKAGEATILNNIGSVYKNLGEKQKGLEYYQQALQLIREIGSKRMEAVVVDNIGASYDELGDNQKALEYRQQALALAREVGDKFSQGYSLNNIGKSYYDLGDNQKALDYYNQSLTLARELGGKKLEATAIDNIGAVYFDLGDKEKSFQYRLQSLALAQQVGNKSDEAITLYNLAFIERDRGNLKASISYIEKTIEIIESLRTKVASQDLRTSFFASNQGYYQFYIDLLMQLHKQQPSKGYDAKALHVSERARARSLLDLLTEAKADIRKGVEPDLLQRERTLQNQLDTLEQQRVKLLSGTHTDAEAKEVETQLSALLEEYKQIEAEIRAKSPSYAALTQPQPLTLAEIQQQVLDDNTILLEYSLGDERSYLWAVTKTGINSYELPKRADIQAAAKEVRQLLTDSELSQDSEIIAKTTAQLSQLILAPVANQLGQKRLLIVGSGILQYIPFGALTKPSENPTEYKPLLVENEIIYAPSASTLAISRKELQGRPQAPKIIAMLADPVFSSDDDRLPRRENRSTIPSTLTRAASESGVSFNRLPFTQQEVNAIAALVPENEREEASGFGADRNAATSANLAQYRIIHFATHGLMNSTNPQLSGLVMSLVDKDGKPQNGFLRLNDIFNLKLSADLVVMSACQTATGKEVKGEGIVGLTRGFMYAGTARVIASLWSVNDPATSQLMTKFYQRYLKEGLPAAAALRAAQLEMFKQQEWHSPYYWAAFTLQGEWK